jgi:hypothetical protein
MAVEAEVVEVCFYCLADTGIDPAAKYVLLGVTTMTVSRWELGTMRVGHSGWLDVMMSLLELRQRQGLGSVDATTAGEVK